MLRARISPLAVCRHYYYAITVTPPLFSLLFHYADGHYYHYDTLFSHFHYSLLRHQAHYYAIATLHYYYATLYITPHQHMLPLLFAFSHYFTHYCRIAAIMTRHYASRHYFHYSFAIRLLSPLRRHYFTPRHAIIAWLIYAILLLLLHF
jgi:hypothetical protein